MTEVEALAAELGTLPVSRAVEIARALLVEVRRARRIPSREQTIARLMSRVRKDEGTGCWIWQGHTNRHGYGGFESALVGETMAHRTAYALLVGPIPPGADLLHACDRPACVNPAHLRPGDALENMADMVSRGRQCNGERNPNAKMTAEGARALIREYAAGEAVTVLEARYGLSHANLFRILKGDRWGAFTVTERASLSRRQRPRGEEHGRARVTEEQVREIRRLHATGVSSWSLARRFGMSPGSIHAIVHRRNWKHVA